GTRDKDIRRLDVAVGQPVLMRFVEGMAHLLEDVHCALGWNWAEARDQGLEVYSDKQLHDVKQRAVVGLAEIVELYGVGRLERRGGPCFAFKASQDDFRIALRGRQELGPNQLHGGRAHQEPMPRSPDFAHTTGAELLFEGILTELVRFTDPSAQIVQSSGGVLAP